MNTPTTSITAADVVAFLQEQASQLAEATGEKYIYLYLEVGNPGRNLPTVWKAYVNNGRFCHGESLELAIAKAISESAPAEISARKRAEAAKLLAEADAIAPASEAKATAAA